MQQVGNGVIEIASAVKPLLAVMVSGGRSSAMMARHIQTSPKYEAYEKLYIFCNTGMERPETIQFLKDMVHYWEIPLNIIEGVYSGVGEVGIQSKVVTFDTMDMTGRVFSEMIAFVNKNTDIGLPNQGTPYCSERLKTRPANHFAKSLFGGRPFVKAIGYRKEDMPRRITIAEIRVDESRIFPLLTDFSEAVSKFELTKYFRTQSFKLGIKSSLGNCELCWKKSNPTLIENIRYGTRFVSWHVEQEQKYNDMFFRDNKSILNLVALANDGAQMSMFENEEDFSCTCSM